MRARKGEKTAHLGHVSEELGGGHGARQTVVLGHVPDLGPYGDALGGVLAENHRRTRRRPDETEKNLDRRALAGSVFAENSSDPVGNGEADVAERNDVLVTLRQVFSGEKCFHDNASESRLMIGPFLRPRRIFSRTFSRLSGPWTNRRSHAHANGRNLSLPGYALRATFTRAHADRLRTGEAPNHDSIGLLSRMLWFPLEKVGETVLCG